jgi:hypothetical protein
MAEWKSVIKVKVTLRLTGTQSVCLDSSSCLKVSVFSMRGALSDERTGLSFATLSQQ